MVDKEKTPNRLSKLLNRNSQRKSVALTTPIMANPIKRGSSKIKVEKLDESDDLKQLLVDLEKNMKKVESIKAGTSVKWQGAKPSTPTSPKNTPMNHSKMKYGIGSHRSKSISRGQDR